MDICFGGGLINNNNLKDRNKSGKYWLLTYYCKWLVAGLTSGIEDILCNLPSISNFIFQIEENEKGKFYVNIAVELRSALSKPVVYLISNFRTGLTIRYIKDIENARQYCSQICSRVPNSKLVYYTLKHGEAISNIPKKKVIISSDVSESSSNENEDNKVKGDRNDEEVKEYIAEEKIRKKIERRKIREKRREIKAKEKEAEREKYIQRRTKEENIIAKIHTVDTLVKGLLHLMDEVEVQGKIKLLTERVDHKVNLLISFLNKPKDIFK